MRKKLLLEHLLRNFIPTVMPFGLKNVGATYQRIIIATFHDVMHQELEDYMDDIVVKLRR